jgi:putative hydrolase of the HAD superfamily
VGSPGIPIRNFDLMQMKYAPGSRRQTLLIDADDTLWENNIYFERAIADFISFLNHREFTPEDIRRVLYEVERKNIPTHGYGMRSFMHALIGTFEKLSVEPLTPGLHDTICGFAHAIAEHPMELIEEVESTLQHLQPRHQLILVTKGNIREQFGKVERSGLRCYFSAVEIVAEKDPPTYSRLVEKHGLIRETTWMVGNSPKSDINPALSAGLNAVFIPHSDTWILEHEALLRPTEADRLMELSRFSDLRGIF